MSNRTGTYFAFDGLGEADPTKSDFRYYSIVQGWDAARDIDFKFVNSHEKASSVRDTSAMATLQASIRKRLAASKNVVIVISPETRYDGSLLSWKIEVAVDYYELPLIVAYTGYSAILDPAALSSRWPRTLRIRILNGKAQAIHVPFKKDAIFNAIRRFTVNGDKIGSSLQHYDRESHVAWGYIS